MKLDWKTTLVLALIIAPLWIIALHLAFRGNAHTVDVDLGYGGTLSHVAEGLNNIATAIKNH